MYLLDTDVLSTSRRPALTPARFAAWIESADPEHLFLSAVSILEVRQGIIRLLRRDREQANRLQTWLKDRVLPQFRGRILPFDTQVALRCAPLHVPDPRPERDAMIAATALEHRLTVVTRNVKDFRPMDVPVLDPWSEG